MVRALTSVRSQMSKSREMINAHLFPVLATVAALSSVSMALSLGAIGGVAIRWNACYNASIQWYQNNKPTFTIQDQKVFAANVCNGGMPVKPGPGMQ